MKSPRTPNVGWVATLFAALAVLSAAISIRAQTVPAPTLTLRTRVMVDANLPPFNQPNPLYVDDGKHSDPDPRGQPRMVRNTPAHDYAVKLGLEECWTIGNGTLNRHPWWSACKDMADFNAHGMTLPEGNFCDPPTQDACVKVGQLLRNPQRFNATARPHCPLFVDIEGTKNFVCFPGYALADRKKYVRQWIDTVTWLRQGAGDAQEVSIYGDVTFLWQSIHGDDDDDELRGLCFKLSTSLNTGCVAAYSWDVIAENRAGMIFGLGLYAGEISLRQYRPLHVASKTVFINPLYQVYWPQNDLPAIAGMGNQPVPFETWRRMVDWLVAHDYQIVLWLGWSDVTNCKPHLQYLAKYALTY